jgi:hypothetical protein
MVDESSKSLIIISVGVEHSFLLQKFLDEDLRFSVILNTTSDFFLTDKESDVWYHHEIVKLANSFVPDDFAQSSLAQIFTKPIAQTKIPLSDSERFLGQWVSEQHRANRDISEFFKVLCEYSNKQIDVHPLKFPETILTLQTEDKKVPLRYFQTTGMIDRESETKTDLEDLQNLLNGSTDEKSKKKDNAKVKIVGLDEKREIMSEGAKKAIAEADAILLLATDPCSLAILFKFKEFTRIVRESNAPVTLICPTRFSFREQFILGLLSIKPTLVGIGEFCSGIVDHLVVGPEDAGEIKTLRSQGFNVLMEDLTKIKRIKDLSSVLKGLGISLSDISVEKEDVNKKLSLEDLVTQLSYSTKKVETTSDLADSIEESETTVELDEASPTNEKANQTVDLQDTEERNFDFDDPALMMTQESIESLMEELSEDFPKTNGQLESKETVKETEENNHSQLENQEAFTEVIDSFASFDKQENHQELVKGITETITKNSDMAGYAAKKLTINLSSPKVSEEFLASYLAFGKAKPLIFIKELVDWLVAEIDSPDYVTFSQKALVIVKMSRIELHFIEQLVEQLITYRVTKSLTPSQKEHLRTLIGMITARDVTLQRVAIRTYLSHYDASKKKDDIWLGLMKYDAALVALEIVEIQGVQIVQDALGRNLGSYGHIIYDVSSAYQKGDLQRVLSMAGSLSDRLVRKKKRIELAAKIIKYGSVPIEILAKNVELEAKDIEALVYEMIEANEINAKIDVVEGRLCIVQLEGKEETSENNA